LDVVSKNELLRDILAKLFPNLKRSNRSKIDDMAKYYQTNWSDWRHQLWAMIQNFYEDIE